MEAGVPLQPGPGSRVDRGRRSRRLAGASLGALASLLAFAGAASACDDPSGDCGGAFSSLSEETVRALSTTAAVAIVATAAMVFLSRHRRRLQAASATLLAVEVLALTVGAVVLG